jgi:hypothetical protein
MYTSAFGWRLGDGMSRYPNFLKRWFEYCAPGPQCAEFNENKEQQPNAHMKEAYFLLLVDPKPNLGHNVVTSKAKIFTTEQEAWEAARNDGFWTDDGRTAGFIVTKGFLRETLVNEKSGWFILKSQINRKNVSQ